jgi:hypothetical protein
MMRRTKATLIYHKTKNPRVIQLLPGHVKLDGAARWRRIGADNADHKNSENVIVLRRLPEALGAQLEARRK